MHLLKVSNFWGAFHYVVITLIFYLLSKVGIFVQEHIEY